MINRMNQHAQDTLLSALASFQVALIQRREDGATAVEYALMVGILIVAIIGSVSLFRTRMTNMFQTYANTLPG
jgi:Flp pilus assembly pilin Flp